jgi:hypothetical protein
MIIASIEDYRKRCKRRLPRFLYDYISGRLGFVDSPMQLRLQLNECYHYQTRTLLRKSRCNSIYRAIPTCSPDLEPECDT